MRFAQHGELAKSADAADVGYRRAQEVDQFLLDEREVAVTQLAKLLTGGKRHTNLLTQQGKGVDVVQDV